MDWTAIIVAVLALIGTLSGSYYGGKKMKDLVNYRIQELERKVDKHNTIIERTYKLEGKVKELENMVEIPRLKR